MLSNVLSFTGKAEYFFIGGVCRTWESAWLAGGGVATTSSKIGAAATPFGGTTVEDSRKKTSRAAAVACMACMLWPMHSSGGLMRDAKLVKAEACSPAAIDVLQLGIDHGQLHAAREPVDEPSLAYRRSNLCDHTSCAGTWAWSSGLGQRASHCLRPPSGMRTKAAFWRLKRWVRANSCPWDRYLPQGAARFGDGHFSCGEATAHGTLRKEFETPSPRETTWRYFSGSGLRAANRSQRRWKNAVTQGKVDVMRWLLRVCCQLWTPGRIRTAAGKQLAMGREISSYGCLGNCLD
ncbi:unnamed protein product [Phaeothamnion confervicola]